MHAPPFISLGQALDLGLGAERKQNKSLPVSSSNSAHSNSSHSQSSQRERQPTTGRNYLFIRLVFLGGFFMRIFFNPESFFFFFPLQSKMEWKGKDHRWRAKQKSPESREIFPKRATRSVAVAGVIAWTRRHGGRTNGLVFFVEVKNNFLNYD